MYFVYLTNIYLCYITIFQLFVLYYFVLHKKFGFFRNLLHFKFVAKIV